MAQVFELASETSRIFASYSSIHDEVFGFSIRGLLTRGSAHERASHADRAQRLEALAEQLRAVQASIRELEDAELSKRSKDAVRATLLAYAGALERSITLLARICRNLDCEYQGHEGYAGYGEGGFRTDKIGYDDSIQAYKREGARLTVLFARL